ncbi:hypothetical protein FDP22_12975 [Paroceanicella profunda]|uniref:Uncharacterized protein n=1 Tax=Paroceanicella profunda TaxID=2579971 RepID=A0A5B8G0I6_9RHOB|nr:hypothetical protein [Paroceanicella profunda]QDL92619.1 hypothetical protein FDP22_12975 [Paroceanicella profunda]
MTLRLIQGGSAAAAAEVDLRAPVWRRFDLEAVGEAGLLIRDFLLHHPDFYPGRLLGYLLHVSGPHPSEEDLGWLGAMTLALDAHQDMVLRLNFGPARSASALRLAQLLIEAEMELADVFAAVCQVKDDAARLATAPDTALAAPDQLVLLQGLDTVLMLDLSQISEAYVAAGAAQRRRAAQRPAP